MSVHTFELPGSGGAPIRGDVWLPDHVNAPAPAVVGLHGFKGFRRWGFWPRIASSMNAAGLAFVGIDMSHNGVGAGGLEFDEPERFEANTWANEEEDLGRVLAALRAGLLPEPRRLDASRVALLGHSRGGALAVVRAASDAGIRATVALAPIATVCRFDPSVLERGRRNGFIPIVNARTGQVLHLGAAAIAEMDSRTDLHDIAASHAARLGSPLLVVHGEADTSVPADEGRALAAAAPRGRYLGIAGADHVLGCRHPWAGTTPAFEEFIAAASDFLVAALR
jgi:alpha-beta hydrolase superfamily lysophospholipase